MYLMIYRGRHMKPESGTSETQTSVHVVISSYVKGISENFYCGWLLLETYRNKSRIWKFCLFFSLRKGEALN
jgi:hypothetical protein